MLKRRTWASLAAALVVAAGTGTIIGLDAAKAGAAEPVAACRFTLERGPAGVDREGRPVENWIVTCNHVAPVVEDSQPLSRGLPSLQVTRPADTSLRPSR